MRRLPPFPALRAFEAAARLGSFSLACRELHLTPSAISHQVRFLEQHFGRPLFIRHNRRIELTSDGRTLAPGLSAAFDAIAAACAMVDPVAAPRSLAVHCAPSFASKYLAPRLPDFMRRHPSISISLSSDAEPVDLARRQEFDLAIVYAVAPEQAGTVVEPLGLEDVCALCSPALAQAFDAVGTFTPGRPTLIRSSVNPVRWSDWFAVNALRQGTPRAGPSFDRGALAVAAAVQGMGVALESRRFALAELSGGALVEFGGGRFRGIRRDLHFLCYRATETSIEMMAFREWLFATLAEGGA